MTAVNRAKFGYLNYDVMLTYLQEEKLNAYDVVFTKDTRECYFINEDLVPLSVNSKVYCFENIIEARSALNNSSDTYVGQLVSIYNEMSEKYLGYIVNKDAYDQFYVTPLYEHPEEIDYDTLLHRPITNIVGTIDEPVLISSLSDGTYSVSGFYNVYDGADSETSIVGVIFVIETVSNVQYITKITAKDITKFIISSTGVITEHMATDKYLADNNYVTDAQVDAKLAALEIITKSDLEEYIAEVLSEQIEDIVEQKMNEKYGEITSDEINELF